VPDRDALLLRWRHLLTGGPGAVPTRVRRYLDAAAAQARASAELLRPRGPGILWPDLPDDGTSAHLTTAAERLRRLALAVDSPGSPLPGDERLAARVVEGVEALLVLGEREPYDNWWDWQIGVPLRLGDLGVLLTPAEPELAARVATTIEHLAPPAIIDSGRPTGANLVWHTTVDALRAVLADDLDRLCALRRALAPLFRPVPIGDGIHPDGSFVQHERLAYTGGYGVSLLATLAPLLTLLSGSAGQPSRDELAVLYRWVRDGVAPYMVDGRMSDAVRGREIARSGTTEASAGRDVSVAVLELAASATPSEASSLRALAIGWIERSGPQALFRPHLDAGERLPPGSLRRVAEALADPTARADDGGLDAHLVVAHPDMARAVYRQPGFTLVLTATTDTIDSSEHINGENLRGWYAGFGARYLYAHGAPSPFGDGFWPTVDPLALPGTTVDDVLAPADLPVAAPGARITTAAAEDSLVVGSRLTRAGSALSGQVSWLCADGVVVSIGSAITDSGGRRVRTTVESRIVSSATAPRLLVDGTDEEVEVGGAPLRWAPRWLHVPGLGGVLFPAAGPALLAMCEDRTGSWAQINRQPRESAEPIRRRYLTLWFDHGLDPAGATFTYAILPGASPEQTRRASEEGLVEVAAAERGLHRARIGNRVLSVTFDADGNPRAADGVSPAP